MISELGASGTLRHCALSSASNARPPPPPTSAATRRAQPPHGSAQCWRPPDRSALENTWKLSAFASVLVGQAQIDWPLRDHRPSPTLSIVLASERAAARFCRI